MPRLDSCNRTVLSDPRAVLVRMEAGVGVVVAGAWPGMEAGVGVVAAGACALGLYRALRPLIPTTVNCHFCCLDTQVSESQLVGFLKEGAGFTYGCVRN